MPPSPPVPPPPIVNPSSPSVTVVIPARNEQRRLPRVLAGLPPVHEVVVVDGGSDDDTIAVAREHGPRVRVVRQTRSGRGNALVCGFAASTGDIVVVLAADGSTDPGELPRFVRAVLAGADVAHGSRYRAGAGNPAGGWPDRLGNRLLSTLANALFGTRFTDLGSGYHAYRRAVLPVLDLPAADAPARRRLWGDGPEIDPLLTVRAAAQGLRVVEVPSVGYPKISGRVARRRLRRAVRALRTVLREWRRSRRGLPVPPRLEPVRRETTAFRYDDRPRFPSNSGSLYDTLTGIGYDRTAARQETTGGVRYPTSAPPPVVRRTPTRHAVPGDPAVHRLDPGDSGVHHLRPAGPRPTDLRSADQLARRPGPAASAVHHLDPADSGRHHLPPADSGVHHLPPADPGVHHLSDSGVYYLDPAERRRRAGAVYGTGTPEGGRRRRAEPDDRMFSPAPPREVGGGRRRLDSRDRPARRPDLTVIRGDGTDPRTTR